MKDLIEQINAPRGRGAQALRPEPVRIGQLPQPAVSLDVERDDEVFSRGYVESLRKENRKLRDRLAEARAARVSAENELSRLKGGANQKH